eukprot:scaffold4852_cov76-Cylindrotheca_fusiformis.AAC.3
MFGSDADFNQGDSKSTSHSSLVGLKPAVEIKYSMAGCLRGVAGGLLLSICNLQTTSGRKSVLYWSCVFGRSRLMRLASR